MGYRIVAPIPERYTKIKGLEGPFRMPSGKILYYDPREGKYYDRDSDYYVDYDPENCLYSSDRTGEQWNEVNQ